MTSPHLPPHRDHLDTEPVEPVEPRSSRRSLLLGAAGVLGAAVTGGALWARDGGLLGASGHPLVDRPAEAGSVAQRLGAPPVQIRPPGDGRLVFPIDPTARSYVLDNFGDCRGTRMHQGMDVMSERGAPVYAVADGVLHSQFTNTGTAGYGWTLRDPDATTAYRYFHLDSFAPGLAVGDRVRFGDVIGFVGSSGNFIWVDGRQVEDRNNIHLHFEVLNDYRTAVDPLPLVQVPDGISVGPPLKSCAHRG